MFFQQDSILKKLYTIEFLKGITRYGVMSLIVSLLMIYQSENDLELGGWTSIFSLFTIIAMYLFGKYYHETKKRKVLLSSAIAILISFISILFEMNRVTIILYNMVYYVFMNILLNITEVNLFDYSNQKLWKDTFNTEYFIVRELFLNIGRILRLCHIIVFCGIDEKSRMSEYFIHYDYSCDYGNDSNK